MSEDTTSREMEPTESDTTRHHLEPCSPEPSSRIVVEHGTVAAERETDYSTFSSTTLVDVAPEWTAESIEQLISMHGPQVVNELTTTGRPLIFDAIAKRRTGCAQQLFAYARERRIPVRLLKGDDDILKLALGESERMTKIVLERLLDRCSTVGDTCGVLTSNFPDLVQKYPKLMSEYLRQDKLSFEYGRFSVPASLFCGSKGRPVAMAANEELNSWEAPNSDAAKQFWRTNSTGHVKKALDDTSGPQVTAVAKFLCIDQRFARHVRNDAVVALNADSVSLRCPRSNFMTFLATADLPVEIFNSEALKSLVAWRFHAFRRRYWLLCLWYLTKAIIFSFFATIYSDDGDGSGSADRRTSLTLLLVSALPLWTTFRSRLHIVSKLMSFLFLVHIVLVDRYDMFFAFLISIQCIVRWLLVVQCLRPLDRVGPFIAMVRYALFDSLPFLFLGTLVLFGFSLAFTILSNRRFMQDDELEHEETCKEEKLFDSIPAAFQTLFHACLGNFDGKVLQFTGSFLSIWRTILFNAFVFVGGIVLISLMVAILSDTYDRVKLKEKAELTKCRAFMVGWLSCTRSTIIRTASRLHFSAAERFAEVFSRDVDSWQSKWRYMHRYALPFYRVLLPPVPDAVNKKYFHYLMPEEVMDHADDKWQGRVLDFHKTLKNESRKHEKTLGVQTRTVLQEFASFKEKCNERFTHTQETVTKNFEMLHRYFRLRVSDSLPSVINDRIAGLEGRLERLEDKIDKVLQRSEGKSSCP